MRVTLVHPARFKNREEMDGLYNRHVQRFHASQPYRGRFARRRWAHRHRLWHMIRNLPRLLQVRRYFHTNQTELETQRREFARHPRQPVDPSPLLGPELLASGTVRIAATAIGKMNSSRPTAAPGATPVPHHRDHAR